MARKGRTPRPQATPTPRRPAERAADVAANDHAHEEAAGPETSRALVPVRPTMIRGRGARARPAAAVQARHNWSYSHTNYVILGLALERITGRPLDVALRRMVLRPLRLRNTVASDTAEIPRPVLYAYSAERRPFLGVPASRPLLDDSTLWNPQWTLARGAVQTTNIPDLTRTAIGIGSGRLLSRRSHRLQIAPHAGFGHPQPASDRCTRLSRRYGYGLGVVRNGPWIVQRSLVNGYAAIASYLPSKRISVPLATRFRARSHDAQGNLGSSWTELDTRIRRVLAPRATR